MVNFYIVDTSPFRFETWETRILRSFGKIDQRTDLERESLRLKAVLFNYAIDTLVNIRIRLEGRLLYTRVGVHPSNERDVKHGWVGLVRLRVVLEEGKVVWNKGLAAPRTRESTPDTDMMRFVGK